MTMVTTRLIGINSIARDSLIGNYFIAGISVPVYQLHSFSKINIQDPNKLSNKRVEYYANLLIESFDFWVEEVKTSELFNDELNNLESRAMIMCYKHLNKTWGDKIYICNGEESREKFLGKIKSVNNNLNINYDNWTINGQDQYMVCTAAALLAKIYYIYHLRELKSRYGDIGTCYQNDSKTIDFIRRHANSLPMIVRQNNPFIRGLLKNI